MARYRHKPTQVDAISIQMIMSMPPCDRPSWVQDRILSDDIRVRSSGLQVWSDGEVAYVRAAPGAMLILTEDKSLRVLSDAAFERNFEVA